MQNLSDKSPRKVRDMNKVGEIFNAGLWGKHLKTRTPYIVYGDS